MTAPTTTPEITRYRDAVRAALADLSAEDRDDLMEDVESHLVEVAAEDGGSLARLGSPEDYAAELRTSAGLPPPSAPAPERFWDRQDAALARGIERMRRSPQGQVLGNFLPELRPGWWVLRGCLVAVTTCALLGVYHLGVALLLAFPAIWGSVWLGRRAATHRRWRRWSIAGNALLVFFFLFVGVTGWSSDPSYDPGPGPQQPGLVSVNNVYVFDSEGRPLSGVQLFDQDGNPLQVFDQAYDVNGMPVEVRRHFDATGQEVHNVFPREPVAGFVPRPQMTAPRLAPTAGPSIAASPGVGPSVPPSGAVTPSASPTPR